MRAGALRNKITIEYIAVGKDTVGQENGTWTTLKTAWAHIKPLTGKEYQSGQTINAEVTHEVRMRYYSGITPKMRVKHGTRYFDILYVLNIEERNRELLLKCKEVI